MYRIRIITAFVCSLVAVSACGGSRLKSKSAPGDSEEGLAVYYADSLHGKKTASGEMYDKDDLTAAHRNLPFGAIVRVTNLGNRRSVEVRINDRGPFGNNNRIIDVSRKAAQNLEMIGSGVIEVRVEIVSMPEKK